MSTTQNEKPKPENGSRKFISSILFDEKEFTDFSGTIILQIQQWGDIAGKHGMAVLK